MLDKHVEFGLAALYFLLCNRRDFVLVVEVLKLLFVLDQLLRDVEHRLKLVLGFGHVAFPEADFVDCLQPIATAFQYVVHLVFLLQR